MAFVRMTRKNNINGGMENTYRVPLTQQEHDLHIKVQGGLTFVYGKIIDRLGRLEDLYEALKKDQTEKDKSRLI